MSCQRLLFKLRRNLREHCCAFDSHRVEGLWISASAAHPLRPTLHNLDNSRYVPKPDMFGLVRTIGEDGGEPVAKALFTDLLFELF